jgi:hypothetical protein
MDQEREVKRMKKWTVIVDYGWMTDVGQYFAFTAWGAKHKAKKNFKGMTIRKITVERI